MSSLSLWSIESDEMRQIDVQNIIDKFARNKCRHSDGERHTD